MKIISLWQPWASAIAHGSKKFETRSWQPPRSLLGQRIGIHAAKKRPQHLPAVFAFPDPYGGNISSLPLGCIVATAILDSVFSTDDLVNPQTRQLTSLGVDLGISELELLLGDYSTGRFAWKMQEAIKLDKPISCRGFQGFFNVDIEADL